MYMYIVVCLNIDNTKIFLSVWVNEMDDFAVGTKMRPLLLLQVSVTMSIHCIHRDLFSI